MTEGVMLALALGAGVVLGGIFFGGLWWTIRKGLSSKCPGRWFMGSVLLRTGIVLAGFYVVGRGQWERLLACLFGFVMARVLVTLLTRPSLGDGKAVAKEAGHAP